MFKQISRTPKDKLPDTSTYYRTRSVAEAMADRGSASSVVVHEHGTLRVKNFRISTFSATLHCISVSLHIRNKPLIASRNNKSFCTECTHEYPHKACHNFSATTTTPTTRTRRRPAATNQHGSIHTGGEEALKTIDMKGPLNNINNVNYK